MKKHLSLILLSSAILIASGCTNYYLSIANKEFENFSYFRAIKNYKRCLSRKEIQEARVNLAHAYRLTNDIKKAEKEYERVLASPNFDPINIFYYAKSLMDQEKYNEARYALIYYLQEEPNDIVAKILLASCNSLRYFKCDTSFCWSTVNADNVVFSFCNVEYKNGTIFTAEKNVLLDCKKKSWLEYYRNLYFSPKDRNGKWLFPKFLKGDVNGQYQEGPATFNKAGNVVYFTRSNSFKYKFRISRKNENNLKIFKAEFVNGKWTNLEDMPFNSDEYSVGHPCLSSDKETLYFVSDMPGGYGGTDIYSSSFDGKKWSAPVNLGNDINTYGNEVFPFASDEGSFYFASDACNNMGGLDVSITSYQKDKWLRPEKLNHPFNPGKFIMKSDNTTIYVPSNRSGSDKVNRFTENSSTFSIEGIVLDKNTRHPLANSVVILFEKEKLEKIELTTDANGRYKTELVAGGDYTVLAFMNGYFSRSEEINTIKEKYSKIYIVFFELAEKAVEKSIVLENIYYDPDKWEITADAARELNKLVKLLNDNPTIKIEIGSHTDSRAGDQYNLILSDKRAQATVSYLISRGIASNRLTWKGYGASMLLHKCSNGVACSEEAHRLNYRMEFKVLRVEEPMVFGTK
ncbi:MAG: OmpA family protein [Bacteroidetes bacterium]|nr:OmpA family protein [Bacteroidota bacterium]